jgi:hypothetical protein
MVAVAGGEGLVTTADQSIGFQSAKGGLDGAF